jgi:hypothetical protein
MTLCPKQLINVIALKLSGSVGHPLFLKTGIIIPVVQVSGIIPVSRKRILYNRQYCCTTCPHRVVFFFRKETILYLHRLSEGF